MKERWLQSGKCSGCGACADICPRNAIEMKPDECGFLYPEINDSCIECNLCEKTCRSRHTVVANNRTVPETYAAWSKNPKTRFSSTSGGLFSELALSILKKGGFVAGAQYCTNNLVEHTVISDSDGLIRIRQSKYIQSNPSGIYSKIRALLQDDKLVLFCGAPCQVSALYAFLGKGYENLFTVDFICRGMNSPKAYLAWLKEIEAEERSRITHVWFKYKVGGWKSSPKRTRLDFEDGHHIVIEGNDNLFMNGYLTTNLFIRPSCGDCDFKGVPRQSDLTLADFWGIEASLDDDGGTSIVLVNSEKGSSLFDEIKESLWCYQKEFQEIFAGNVCFSKSVEISPRSRRFLCSLDKMPFSKAVKKYSKDPLKKRIKRGLLKRIRYLSRP